MKDLMFKMIREKYAAQIEQLVISGVSIDIAVNDVSIRAAK